MADSETEFRTLLVQIQEKRAFNDCRKLEFDKRPRDSAGCFVAYHDRELDKPDRAEALLRAAREYRKARDPAAALSALDRLSAEHPGSEAASSVDFERGEVFASVALLADAAAAYEVVAREPASLPPDQHVLALTRAASYWLALGESGRVLAVLDAYCERFPNLDDAARFCLDRGRASLGQDDPEGALRANEQWFRQFEKTASADLLAQAHTLAGLAHWRRGDRTSATASFGRTLDEWERLKSRAEVYGRHREVTEKGREAIAMAAYYRGEAYFEELRAIPLNKAFPADPDRASNLVGLAHKAARAFEDVPSLESPTWANASHRRVAETWGHIAEAVTETLDALLDEEHIDSTTQSLIDDAVDPYRRRALDAYRQCHDRAIGLQWIDENALACRRRLAELDPTARVPRAIIPRFDDRVAASENGDVGPATEGDLRAAVLGAVDEDARYLALLRHHYHRGEFEAVALVGAGALVHVHDKATVQTLMGLASMRRGRLREAWRAFDEARQAEEGHIAARLNLALMALTALDANRAEPLLDAVLQRAPSDPVAQQAWAFLRLLRGSLTDAVGSYRAHLAVDPSNPDLRWNLCAVLSGQETAQMEALEACRAFVAAAPEGHPDKPAALAIIDSFGMQDHHPGN